MEILVDRFVSDDDTTISRVFVDGTFNCFGLEDEYRENKIVGKTRIPAGDYAVDLYTAGDFHKRYGLRHPDFHQGMLHLQNVPGFTDILIHCGNTHLQTEGCLIVGSNVVANPGDMSVTSSKVAYERFYPLVLPSALAGDLRIRYEDNDR